MGRKWGFQQGDLAHLGGPASNASPRSSARVRNDHPPGWIWLRDPVNTRSHPRPGRSRGGEKWSRKGGRAPRSNIVPCAPVPSRCPSTRTLTPTAGRPTSLGSPPLAFPGEPPNSSGPRGGEGFGAPVLRRPSPPSPRGTARTYLQPGFLVAATPSDAPAASAGPRQPYRSCIASKMPIRRPRSGA